MPEDNQSPITAAVPPVVNSISTATALHASTLKLKPIIRQPRDLSPKSALAETAKLSQTGSLEHLKTMTQKLKTISQELPAQAILRKTGVLGDVSVSNVGLTEAQRLAAKNRTSRLDVAASAPRDADFRKTGIVDAPVAGEGLTDAQRLAAKNRTSRISLSEAIGAAPVKENPAPIKTIRIKRPANLPDEPAPLGSPAPLDLPAAVESDAPASAADSSTSVTQRKTLKISRPGAGGVKPAGKFALKRPSPAATPVENGAAAPAGGDAHAVADIPNLPDDGEAAAAMRQAPLAPQVPPGRVVEVSKGLQGWSMTLQFAACVTIGVLVYFLYLKTQLPLYLGGLL